MISILFIVAGIVSGIHVYTYGSWLKQQGNISGSILAYVLAAMAAILPAVHFVKSRL